MAEPNPDDPKKGASTPATPAPPPAATTSGGVPPYPSTTTFYHRSTDESTMTRASYALRVLEQPDNPGNYNFHGPGGFVGPTFTGPPGQPELYSLPTFHQTPPPAPPPAPAFHPMQGYISHPAYFGPEQYSGKSAIYPQ